MHKQLIPAPRISAVDLKTGHFSREWWRFFHALWQQTGLDVFEVTVALADLADGGQKILVRAGVGGAWKVREIFLSGDGTDFSGGGNDRDLAITDGTSTWSIIPAATLQSLVAARWGDAGMPFPATASHLFAASVSGASIVAQYSGGTTDYTAGSATIMLLVERIA